MPKCPIHRRERYLYQHYEEQEKQGDLPKPPRINSIGRMETATGAFAFRARHTAKRVLLYTGQWENDESASAYILFNPVREEIQFAGDSPHALRHTMATLSIANGADIVSISEKLGHSEPSITLNVYSHANEEAQRRANEVLAEAIYNNQKHA